jgi:hypothetical protein
VANAVLGTALGLFARAFASSEFQAVLAMTYAYDALSRASGPLGATVLALALGALTLRRQTS